MATTIFELLGRVALDNASANKGIKETTGIAESASQKINAAFEKVGHAAIAVGKTIATGMAAGAAAIGALTKASIEGYAEYEQLVDGVETLFGNSQGKVLQYAQNAYKTAGMSANEYMSTVTSFSASLLQGLDGDTKAAALIANRAITDMSDNANKMGTDISMIQNAYQGFAKQNYTMLDNLKLGYGGTQAEMARLVNESGVLGDTIEVTAETINEVSFDKIIKAIGVVQDRMWITGTTAREASETISGSIASARAAWQNLLVGMADDNADFEKLINQFVDTVGIAAKNIVPRIEIALEGAGKLVDTMFPIIIEKIPKIINNFLPKVVNSAVSIVESLVSGIDKNKNTIFETAVGIATTIIEAITDMLPDILDLGVELLLTIVDGIVENLDQVVSSALEITDKIIDTLTKPSTLSKLLDASLEIIVAIADGIVEFLPELTEAATSVVEQIVETATEDSTLSALLDAAIAVVLALSEFIINNVTLLVDACVTVVTKIVEYLTADENREKLSDAALKILKALVEGIVTNTGTIATAVIEIFTAITKALDELNWWDVGADVVSAIAEGIKDGWTNLWSGTYIGRILGFNGEFVNNSGLGSFGSSLDGDEPNVQSGSNANKKPLVKLGATGVVQGRFKTGLDYVPFDGFVAELHKGEMVVPAEESKFLRSGALGLGNGEVVRLLESILHAVQDGSNATMTLNLNEREFARAVKAVN